MTTTFSATLRVAETAATCFHWHGPAEAPEAAAAMAREAADLVWRAEARLATVPQAPPERLKEEIERSSDGGNRVHWNCGHGMTEALGAMEREDPPETFEAQRLRALCAKALALSDEVMDQAYRDGLKVVVQINGRQGLGQEVGSVAYACDDRGGKCRHSTVETQTIAKALGPWLVPGGWNREFALAVLDHCEAMPASATLRAKCSTLRRIGLGKALKALHAEVAALGAPRLEAECLRRIAVLRETA